MPATRMPARSGATGSRPSSGGRSGTAVRSRLSPDEVEALRELKALRTAMAERGSVAAGRGTTTRAAIRAGRPRQPARRTGTATATRRGAATRGRPTRRSAPSRTGLRWSTRISVVALSTLVLPALASLAVPGVHPGQGAGSPVASPAVAAQTMLLEHGARYRQLEQELARRTADLRAAEAAEDAALTEVTARRDVVGAAASALYRSAPAGRLPVLALDVQDPDATDDVLFQQAVADRDRQVLQASVVRAERTAAVAEAAGRRVTEARSAVAATSDRADAVLASARADAGKLGVEVSAQLAALGSGPPSNAQQDRNQQALRRWQDHLGRLAAGGITPPTAAELADVDALPRGLTPALDGDGEPVPGVAWAVVGSAPVTVLPAETVTAVSTAFSQLGKPFVPGTAGPDTYDCGGLTAASWLLAGYAVPPTPQGQWAGGTPVPMSDLQIGDLVFSPGGRDVGMYLGNGEVLGSSAATFQVGVRPMAAGSSAVRVTLPPPATENAALPSGSGQGACGAALPAADTADAAWGGFANGRIPSGALCRLGVAGHALRCDAAAAYGQLSAAYAAAFGRPMCITDSYRSLAGQVDAFAAKPGLAAVPGTSNHGWGLAVDLCDGVNVAGTAPWTWMTHHAGAFGFVQPDWARPGSEKPEPWHWEFGDMS